jgi:2'-hydroxyisoflavone reductase
VFLGRAIVDAALEQGHEPTLLNRGQTNPDLFPEVEKLRGDRSSDLSALEGREWDAVIDVATDSPDAVRRSTDALRDCTSRYVYVSSISVYSDVSSPPGEDSPVLELEPGDEEAETAKAYGGRKAACEGIVREAFADRALVVRPGLIVGPHDPTGRFTYWPHRVARGGDVLAPGSPGDPVQFIDVRDLAAWIVSAIARGVGGTFNATGELMPFATLLDECRAASGSDASFTWVASDRLLGEEVVPWIELPLWIGDQPGYEYFMRAPVERAVRAGLTFRPLAETIRGTLADAEPVEGVGLAPERERDLLALAHT